MPWLDGLCVVADNAGPNENRPLDDASLGREGPSETRRDKISDPAVGTGMVENHEIDAYSCRRSAPGSGIGGYKGMKAPRHLRIYHIITR